MGITTVTTINRVGRPLPDNGSDSVLLINPRPKEVAETREKLGQKLFIKVIAYGPLSAEQIDALFTAGAGKIDVLLKE